MHVYLVQFESGPAHALSLLRPEEVQQHGLPPATIMGVLKQAPTAQNPITPEEFEPNREFLLLMHQVIAESAPQLTVFQQRSKGRDEGFLYVVDLRTAKPREFVPPEDLIGALRIENGEIVEYSPNANHQLLTERGWFRLFPELKEALHRRLREVQTAPQS
jgi:hypothetical protein